METTLSNLEEKLSTLEHKPVIEFMPETTSEDAKREYERQNGSSVTDIEIKESLPLVFKIITSIHSQEGVEVCLWIQSFCP
jgi:hypothetical protein